MDNRRLILFLVMATVILVGSSYLQNWCFPPPQKPPEQKLAKADPKMVEAVQRNLPAVLANHPSGIKWFVPVDLQISQLLAQKAKEVETLRLAAEAKAAAQQAAKDPVEDFTLGGAGYKLTAVVNKQGVRSITLNHYQDAHRDTGEPEFLPGADGKKIPKVLTLVNDDYDGRWKEKTPAEKLERLSYRVQLRDASLPDDDVLYSVDWREEKAQRTNQKAVFVGDVRGKNVQVTKTLELRPGTYHIDMRVDFEVTKQGEKADLVYLITSPRGLPVEGALWKQAPFRTLMIGSVNSDNAAKINRTMYDPRTVQDGKAKPFIPGAAGTPQDFQYAGVAVQYFAALTVVNADPTQAKYIERVIPQYFGDDEEFPPGAIRFMGQLGGLLRSHPVKLDAAAGKPTAHSYLLYAGPLKVRLLNYEEGVEEGLADRYENEYNLSAMTDAPSYAFWGKIGWTGLIVWFTNLMHWLLIKLYGIFGNYGVAIIFMTIIVRGMMFPISRKQALTSQRMQKLGPELQKLKEKFKDDKQAMAAEQMKLYRKHGVNPLSGCLIVFLQLPVFMGLYYALYESVQLRLAPFWPLWIDNLAAPDMLFYWGDWSRHIFLNLGPYFHLLPIIAITLMFLQQKMMAPPMADAQAAANMKMMNFMMIFMGYMFYWVAAGLCVYFVVSSGWGMLERKLIPKMVHETATPLSDKPPSGPPGAYRGDGRGPKNGKPSGGVFNRIGSWWRSMVEKADKR